MTGLHLGTLGPPHSAAPSREEIQLEQVRRAGWPCLDVADLVFGKHFIEHVPTGDLYQPHRGEIEDSVYTSASSYYLREGGTIAFLQRPAPGLPRTRAELLQRKEPKPARRVRRR